VLTGERFDLTYGDAYYGLFVRDSHLGEARMLLTRRGAAWLASAVVLGALTVSPVSAQTTQTNKKLSDSQKREIQAILKIVEGAAAGQPAPNDLSLTWVREDMLKAQGNRQYVPFTVSIDPSQLTGGNVTMYWRVVAKGQAAAPPPAASEKKDDKKKDKDAAPQYAYEDLTAQPVPAGQPGPLRLSRSFTVPAGSYDVLVVVKELTSNQRNAPAPKVSFLTHSVDVPNFWGDELSTSSVFVGRIEPLPAPLTPQQQLERPYALGAMEIVPAPDSSFAKSEELETFLLIYNAKTDAANKPDLTVEFNFYTKQGGGEKFFNKTSPQSLNAQTLPKDFDLNAGHQLQTGQAVGLGSFPEGEYRLEIKVTDKLGSKSVTREVHFTVTAS
jgi:hypothetical protein